MTLPVPPRVPGPAHTPPAEICRRLGVDSDLGLDPVVAAQRLAEYGPNRLPATPGRSAWRRFVDQFRSVLVAILAGAALVAAALGDVKDAAIIAVVLVLNAGLGYIQEGRAETAMSALREMLVTRSRVRRGGIVTEVPTDDLVPGDIVLLEAGDLVPADGRLVHAVSLAVDESSLTGESVPVDKAVEPTANSTMSSIEQDRCTQVFMNTTVVRGRAELVVTGTGMATEIGRVATLIDEAPAERTPLQAQLDRLGTRLAMVAALAVAVVFASRVAQGEPLGAAVIDAVALAVAAIPEGLPAVVTVTLALGVRQMALRNAVVKRLASVETLGSTTVICSDKTGTLTRNQMTVREIRRAGRVWVFGDERTPAPDDLLTRALEASVLCNDASIDDGTVLGDPTEGALLAFASRAGVDVASLRTRRPRIAEVPFDSTAKFMVTVHRIDSHLECLVKGAPEVILDRAIGLDDGQRAAWEADNEALADRGMRVLAVASKLLPATEIVDDGGPPTDSGQWTTGLTVEALIGIVDPPRAEAREAIARCDDAGVMVKMITGDHATTARTIAAELGIVGRVVTGAELDALSDEDLAKTVTSIGVCARVSPEHKVRVVRALKKNGHIVAMTGDGVNDAAALRHADIGVAMGITGTEVTKEAADMVLADDDFATIVGAVERGRAIYDNIVKFVRFQLTTNLAAIGTLLIASLAGLPAPLSAVQVLFVNIIADGPPALTLGVDPPSSGTMDRPPRPPGAPILDRPRIVRLLGAAAVMVIGTLGVLVLARDRWGQDVALTMAFSTFVLFQLANVVNARTEQATILKRESLTNRKLWAAVASIAVIQWLIVAIGPLQRLFGTTALTAGQWLVCIGVAVSVIVTEEIRKAIDRRWAGPPRSTEVGDTGIEPVTSAV